MSELVPVGTTIYLKSSAKRYHGGPATIIGHSSGRTAAYRVQRAPGAYGAGRKIIFVSRSEFDVLAPGKKESA